MSFAIELALLYMSHWILSIHNQYQDLHIIHGIKHELHE